MSEPGVKAILGYDIVEGVAAEEYERWLWDIHYPDLLANPFLDRVVLNIVERPITATSAGTATANAAPGFGRIAELHFANHEAYDRYLQWFEEHPIPVERSPAGRTEFRFYVLCDVAVAEREAPA
ncbi:MAG TPA: hypothetical protein VLG28_03610 [Acidimicrobiia bacterium]|nr:hypothetical protein [Acidimicrobiia bacterium]